MKIKKYILLGSLAIMSTGITSCGSDWLDITNNTQDTVEDYYTTDDNIWQSVVAAYDPLHWFDYANNYTGLNIYPEVLADHVFPRWRRRQRHGSVEEGVQLRLHIHICAQHQLFQRIFRSETLQRCPPLYV